jgi:tRNA(Ile)-lysidine synthase
LLLELAFAAALERLGPFGAAPRLAVGVSGGADSMALAALAQRWTAARGGDVRAFIVDHGLRGESAAEADLTAARLAALGIGAEILTLSGLGGPGLQARARAARHAALGVAAVADGRLFLLLGHHAADQAETVAMRGARGPGGAEGMAGWSARADVLVLRPLLGVGPADLRDYLRAKRIEWVEDPSNEDARFERVRIRQAGAGVAPAGPEARQAEERASAAFLARFCAIYPEGYAVLDAPATPPAALAALLRIIGGATYAPAREAVAALGAKIRPATLGGVLIRPAGRLGPGWLVAREPGALAAPVPARASVIWDGRFRLEADPGPGLELGALGRPGEKMPEFNHLPAIVRRTLPCLRDAGGVRKFPVAARFIPPAPATSHPFFR